MSESLELVIDKFRLIAVPSKGQELDVRAFMGGQYQGSCCFPTQEAALNAAPVQGRGFPAKLIEPAARLALMCWLKNAKPESCLPKLDDIQLPAGYAEIKAEELKQKVNALKPACAHLEGYWIRTDETFRCYGCGYQFDLKELPKLKRDIEHWRAKCPPP